MKKKKAVMAELIEAMTVITQKEKSNAEYNLVAFLVCMEEILVADKVITLPLFGTFKKELVHGVDEEEYEIIFEMSKELQQRINTNKNG